MFKTNEENNAFNLGKLSFIDNKPCPYLENSLLKHRWLWGLHCAEFLQGK